MLAISTIIIALLTTIISSQPNGYSIIYLPSPLLVDVRVASPSLFVASDETTSFCMELYLNFLLFH